MKYIKEALLKSRGIYYMIAHVVISMVYIVIQARILLWISEAIENYKDPIHWINLVAIGCIIQVVLSAITDYCYNWGQQLMFTKMSNDMSVKINKADYDVFTKFSPGDIVTISGSLWHIVRIPTKAIGLIKSLISFVVNLITIGFISGVVMIPIAVVYTIGGIILFKTIRKWGECDSELHKVSNLRDKELDESINGFAEVRSFPGSGQRHIDKIKSLNHKALNIIKRRRTSSVKLAVIIDLIDGIATIGLMAYLILALQSGTMSSTSIAVSVIMYMWRLIDPLMNIIDTADQFSESTSKIPKYTEFMDTTNVVPVGKVEFEGFDDDSVIEFQDVDFSYDKSSQILKGVNFKIKKGEHIGICGPTGGGKSTLLKLLMKFYSVNHGAIKIDGISLDELETESYRKYVGMVHQNPHIFDGTLFENIKYAVPGATDEEVYEACKKACIYDFIMTLPERFGTNVGPRGLKLSGGQKQRIALARLFLLDPEVIVLDEATSALDNETEEAIQDALKQFTGKTMITVAHRLSTIKDSDRIVVIKEHTVAEQGTHDELVAKNGIYAAMLR